MALDLEKLRGWFIACKRSFPWRETATAYSVWVSEMMLQQTRASVAATYFQRWMAQFPSIVALAQASEEEVMKAWEGLGYYARAKSLHQGAKTVVARWSGALPSTREELAKIKGLGPYTIGALLSFAFHKRAAAVDGNVARVLSRLFYIEEDVTKEKTKRHLEMLTLSLLPQEEPWVIMEALIELGATLCQKKTDCSRCPLKTGCLAFERKEVHRFPLRGKKVATELLTRYALILIHKSRVLVRKTGEGKVMAGLYHFPFLEERDNPLKPLAKKLMGQRVEFIEKWESVNHSFTRYRVELIPSLWRVDRPQIQEGDLWISCEELGKLPFSAGDRQLLTRIALCISYTQKAR